MKRHPISPEDMEKTFLSKNECLFPSISLDIEFEMNIKGDDLTRYHTAYHVEEKLKDRLKVDYVFTNHGSECVIRQIIEHLVMNQECKYWVIPQPTFELARFYADHYGCTVESPQYIYTDDFDLNLDIDYPQDKVLYMVSPHNPTGLTLTYEDIDELCNKYKYVIIDEAYIRPDESVMIQRENLILVRTFSKMGGITGLRFGLGICFDKDLYEGFVQTRPMYMNSITLKYVDYILDNFITNQIEQRMKDKLSELDPLKIVAKAGNFVLFKNIDTYDGYELKEYDFNGHKFYRMTLHE